MKNHGELSKKVGTSKFRLPFGREKVSIEHPVADPRHKNEKSLEEEKSEELDWESSSEDLSENSSLHSFAMRSLGHSTKDATSKEIKANWKLFADNEDSNRSTADPQKYDDLSSSYSSGASSVLSTYLGPALNMEAEPPLPLGTHTRRVAPEALSRVVAPHHLQSVSSSKEPVHSFGQPLTRGETRIEITSADQYQGTAQPSRRAYHLHSGLFTFTAPTAGPPSVLPPLPFDPRTISSRTIITPFGSENGSAHRHERRRVERNSLSTASYASLSLEKIIAAREKKMEHNRIKIKNPRENHVAPMIVERGKRVPRNKTKESYVHGEVQSSDELKERRTSISRSSDDTISTKGKYSREEKVKLWWAKMSESSN